MAYKLTSALDVKLADKNFIEAGIHENISLVGVRAEKSVNGNNFIEFKFANDSNASFTHTEYEPSRTQMDTDETMDSKANNQLSRILQLMKVFYTTEALASTKAEFDSFEGMTKWVKESLDAADKTQKMRVKIVYNDKGFTTLPRYAKYTFIEPMSVSITDSKIKVLGIDTMVRPAIVADSENTSISNPLLGMAQTTANTSTTSTNGLPF